MCRTIWGRMIASGWSTQRTRARCISRCMRMWSSRSRLNGAHRARHAAPLLSMRIIAGEFRGRKIVPPQGDATRPITDRVKQSLFDILTPRIDGARIYDLFAGTGSMGLECLSRGAAHSTFFEADRSALERLKKNIAALTVESRSAIIPGDLFKWFSTNTSPESADIIFLDPPYRFLTEQPEKLRNLALSIAT